MRLKSLGFNYFRPDTLLPLSLNDKWLICAVNGERMIGGKNVLSHHSWFNQICFISFKFKI